VAFNGFLVDYYPIILLFSLLGHIFFSHRIASLYTWRYKSLSSLPHVEAKPEFQQANAGFVYDYQFLNVDDYNGVGESAPSPYFYQV